METVSLVLCIVQLVSGLILTAVVLFQSGKRSGLSGAISGAADTFMSKNAAKAWDARLARATKWIAALFVLITLLLNFQVFQV